MNLVNDNRILIDLNGLDAEDFVQQAQKSFNIRVANGRADARPNAPRQFGLYTGDYWYSLTAIEGTWFSQDPLKDLDVSVLHDNLLTPLLGITDTRTSKRLDFVPQAQGLEELEKRVDSGKAVAAIAVFPLTAVQLQQLSDDFDLTQLLAPKPATDVNGQGAQQPG